jgi:hypothetical protein
LEGCLQTLFGGLHRQKVFGAEFTVPTAAAKYFIPSWLQ